MYNSSRPCTLSIALAGLGMALFAATPAYSQNVLVNPGFETPQDPANPTATYSITGSAATGPSAAAGFTMYNNYVPTTTTSLLTSTDTLAPPGKYMIHVQSNGDFNGIYQIFTALPNAYVSVDVFVNSGTAALYDYTNGGHTIVAQKMSTALNQWQSLSFFAPSSSDEFVLYTSSSGDFYADNAYVSQSPRAVPEASTTVSFGLLALGGTAMAVRKKKASAAV